MKVDKSAMSVLKSAILVEIILKVKRSLMDKGLFVAMSVCSSAILVATLLKEMRSLRDEG
ncbi:MAG: hypothetical protein KME22_00295 [Hassallia sp. WJT32-NPBG1]|jgi:hypothetical protein|nr:hypothetical protein [Hassallia sp. WJT32-NPBG1]